MIDSIEGGDKFGMLTKFMEKQNAIDIPDSIFEVVHNGMQGVVDAGTGTGAKVPGIAICGKTGTVENYEHGIKQPNPLFFCALHHASIQKLPLCAWLKTVVDLEVHMLHPLLGS
jgi:penicillin-binding protein 2